jgi:hypothetical protein
VDFDKRLTYWDVAVSVEDGENDCGSIRSKIKHHTIIKLIFRHELQIK